MFATQVLREDFPENGVEDNEDAEVVGLVEVQDQTYEIRKGETKIGRDPTVCSVAIENSTVSKIHAVIESDGIDETFIYDNNSTNQTKLGKKILKPHCRYKLENDSKITLGNFTIKFLLPHNVSSSKPALGNNSPDVLEDIFEVATQVSAPHPQTSRKVFPMVEPEKFQVFKAPISVGVKGSSGLSRGSPEASRTEYCGSPVNTSGIFSLSTQCQIVEPAKEGDKSTCIDDQGGNKSDDIKSLLNDGQDDVLCEFMSVHFPSCLNELPVSVKTEVEEQSVYDVETQVQAVMHSSGEENMGKALQINEKANSQSSHESGITSNSVNEYNVNLESFISEEFTEEDFIKTQEFNINLEEKQSKAAANPVGADAPTESEECYFEETVSTLKENEDLICTQKFDILEEDRERVICEVLDSEEAIESDEDFMATQVYDPEQELKTGGTSGESLVVSESPEKDTAEPGTDLTQRTMEEDGVSTQVFGEVTSAGSGSPGEEDVDHGSDDEDFIATQPVDLLTGRSARSEQCQEPDSRVEAVSRESSPDLLDSEFSAKVSEDFIGTETFEDRKFRILESPVSETPGHTAPMFSDNVKKEASEDFGLPGRVADPVESSGDETESDLEIIFDKNDTSSRTEIAEVSENIAAGFQQPESSKHEKGYETDESQVSYIFQVEPEPVVERTGQENAVGRSAEDSDSDATDCEIEFIKQKVSVKEEVPEGVFEETQVLTLTPPENFAPAPNPCWTVGKLNSKPEDGNDCCSQLCLAIPSTQDMEASLKRILQKEEKRTGEERDGGTETPAKVSKTEVGSEAGHGTPGQVDSPLKRPGSTTSEVPTKKPKRERQFSKLWQELDMEQIQPSRTRNSLRKAEDQPNKAEVSAESSVTNKVPPSRRRGSAKDSRNGEIGSRLSKKVERRSPEGRKKETPPRESRTGICERVLRSSRRVSTTPVPPEGVASRRSRRRSSVKSDDYFRNSCVSVVFTGFDCEALEKIISELGGRTTSDLSSGDVVVADKVRRTVKFLSAVGLSLPIASPQWLASCKAERRFLNPWGFILKDEESERKWGFDLKASLERAAREKILLGLSVYATENAKPPVKDLLAIVECCGGIPLFSLPETWPRKTLIVSCMEDKGSWPVARCRNIRVVHYEFILSGVLTQRLDFKTYKLR